MSEQQTIQEALITDGTFVAELSGYSASAAAAELLHHWQSQAPVSSATKQLDVLDTITALQKWMAHL